MTRLLSTLLRHRRAVVVSYLVLVAAAAPGLLRLESDNSPEAFFVRDAAALEQYRQLQLTFGSFEPLRVVASGSGLWTPAGLTWLSQVEAGGPSIPGVLGAAGLWGLYRDEFGEWPPNPQTLRTKVIADSLSRNAGWVSRDGDTVTVLLALRHHSAAMTASALAEIENQLGEAPPGLEVSLAGLPVVERALNDSVRQVAVRFFPLLAVLATALLALALGSTADVLRSLGLVLVCQVVVFGAMGWAGTSVDIVIVVLAPLLFVIGLATAVHVLLESRRITAQYPTPNTEPEAVPEAAVIETYRQKGWPLWWAGVTTAIGFASLSFSRVPPVRALGAWSAFAIALLTLASFTLYPVLLASQRGRSRSWPSAFEDRALRWGAACAAWAIQRRTWVIGGFSVVTLFFLFAIPRLEIQTHALSYFQPDHPVRAQLERLEALGIGVVDADLVLRRRPEASAVSTDHLDTSEIDQKLGQLTAKLRAEPLVLGALSVEDFQPAVGTNVSFTGENPLRMQGASLLERAGALRVSMLIPMKGFGELEPLFARSTDHARRLFPSSEVTLTGSYPLVLAAQRTLLRTMITSLTLTFLLIAAIFVLFLRPLRLAVLALIPNIFPVVVVLGVMGWLGVPIDSSTVMIAAVVLGLAVDDTLHVLGHFRRLVLDREPASAARETLRLTAPAQALTSVVLAAGFLVVGLSPVVPVARFGLLTGIAILFALAADLLLLPALLAGPKSVPARDSFPVSG